MPAVPGKEASRRGKPQPSVTWPRRCLTSGKRSLRRRRPPGAEGGDCLLFETGRVSVPRDEAADRSGSLHRDPIRAARGKASEEDSPRPLSDSPGRGADRSGCEADGPDRETDVLDHDGNPPTAIRTPSAAERTAS